jgi:hypothetical protein
MQWFSYEEAKRRKKVFESAKVMAIWDGEAASDLGDMILVLQWDKSAWLVVGSYDTRSDDYAVTNAKRHAEQLAKREQG